MGDHLDQVFRALGDPTRRLLLDLLRERPRTTGELAEGVPGLSRFGVMKHLGVLADAGLVVMRREGRKRWNYLNAVPLRMMYERWVSRYESAWAGSLLGLKRLAESGGEAMSDAKPEMPPGMIPARVLKIEHELRIEAPVERVWRAITAETGAWWPHRFKDDSKVVLEPAVGGRFYEDWGGGHGALYAEVVYIDPPRALCTRGPMGMRGAASTVKWYRLEEQGGGTLVKVSLHASGDIPDDVAAGYQKGAAAVLDEGLKPYVERGKMYGGGER
jgi:DNA-binding transcriptional ArsR family regulator